MLDEHHGGADNGAHNIGRPYDLTIMGHGFSAGHVVSLFAADTPLRRIISNAKPVLICAYQSVNT